VAPTLTGDHQNRVTDYTAILAIETRHEEPRCYEDGVSPAIIARAGTGGGNTPMVLMEAGVRDGIHMLECSIHRRQGGTDNMCESRNRREPTSVGRAEEE
jgi:hypothetical protein